MLATLCSSMLVLLIAGTFFASEAHAETFEFLTFTPPPGWGNQVSPDKTVYQRRSGIGMVSFYQSYGTTRSAAEEFAEIWRARVEPILPGIKPQPQIERDGDFTVAVGQHQVNAQGTLTTIILAAFVGRGRAIGVLSMSAGDDVLREIVVFF